MTEHYFSGRRPATIPDLKLPGSSLEPSGKPFNVMDHWATEYRAKGTSIIDAERAQYGSEISEWSFGYDIGLQIGEDNWAQFKAWKEQTETPQAIDIIPVGEEIGYKISTRERWVEGAKYVHDSEVHLPINRVGVYVSKAENLRDAVTNYMGSGEMQQLDKFMNIKGYRVTQNIDSFLVADLTLPNGVATAAVHRLENWLAFNKDFRKFVALDSKAMGVDYDTDRMYVIAHEIVHLYGINSEEKLENLLLEFYLSRADKEPEGYTEGVSKSIRSERDAYLEKAKIPLSRLAAMGKKPSFNIEAVVAQLFTEAREKGLSGEEAGQYVDGILSEHDIDAVFNEYLNDNEADYSDKGQKGGDYADRKDAKASKEASEDGELAESEIAVVDGEAAAEGGEGGGEGASG